MIDFAALFGGKGRPLVGLDISSSAVKMVELTEAGSNQYRLERYAIEPLPRDAVTDGNIASLDGVADAIRKAWKRLGTSTRSVALALPVLGPQAPPTDFSGRWVLDQNRSTSRKDNAMVLTVVGMLGERFVAVQNAKTLTLNITALGRQFTAVYNLDGSPSRLQSPTGPGQPDETITSYAAWEGNRLVVRTTSAEELNGKPVQMTTRRTMWIGAISIGVSASSPRRWSDTRFITSCGRTSTSRSRRSALSWVTRESNSAWSPRLAA